LRAAHAALARPARPRHRPACLAAGHGPAVRGGDHGGRTLLRRGRLRALPEPPHLAGSLGHRRGPAPHQCAPCTAGDKPVTRALLPLLLVALALGAQADDGAPPAVDPGGTAAGEVAGCGTEAAADEDLAAADEDPAGF